MWWTDHAPPSLSGRLALGLVAGTVVVLSLSFTALHLVTRDELYQHFDEDLTLRMQAVATYAAAHRGAESVAAFMPQYREWHHEEFFQIWDARGDTIVRSGSSGGRDLPRRQAVLDTPTFYDLQLPDGHRGRAVTEAFALPAGDARATLTVVTALETEHLETLHRRMHWTFLLGAGATIAAMLLIVRISIVRGLRPVDQLARSLQNVNPDDPPTRLDDRRLPSELRPVAASFAALLGRLLETLAREKRYARNVAHELRNPLAELRLLADLGSGGQDLRTVHAAMRDIGAAAAEMEQIVDSLLALTRYEAGLEVPQPEPIDLCAELRRQVGALQALADQHGLTVALDLEGERWEHTDSTLVGRLLANLLGNAIAHAPRGSVVQVQVTPDGVVRLANPAPHLTATDVTRLGERFFRISSGDGGPHAGLGMALAAAIAKVLQLRLDVRLRDDGWLVASVSGFQSLSESVERQRQSATEAPPPHRT
jgi:signal transduction histidine kinase